MRYAPPRYCSIPPRSRCTWSPHCACFPPLKGVNRRRHHCSLLWCRRYGCLSLWRLSLYMRTSYIFLFLSPNMWPPLWLPWCGPEVWNTRLCRTSYRSYTSSYVLPSCILSAYWNSCMSGRHSSGHSSLIYPSGWIYYNYTLRMNSSLPVAPRV